MHSRQRGDRAHQDCFATARGVGHGVRWYSGGSGWPAFEIKTRPALKRPGYANGTPPGFEHRRGGWRRRSSPWKGFVGVASGFNRRRATDAAAFWDEPAVRQARNPL